MLIPARPGLGRASAASIEEGPQGKEGEQGGGEQDDDAGEG